MPKLKEKKKKTAQNMPNFKKNDIPVRVCSVPTVFRRHHGVTGTGFTGTGTGWTARTRAIPVCHPIDHKFSQSVPRPREP